MEESTANFIAGSSKAAGNLTAIWEGIFQPVFDFMKPLTDAASGLVTLLKLLP